MMTKVPVPSHRPVGRNFLLGTGLLAQSLFGLGLLGLGLLLPTAKAQTTIPAVPAPASAAPATAPATSTAAPMLTLNAPVGSSVELQSIMTSRISVSNVQVSAAPGSKISKAKLDEAQREMTRSLQGVNKTASTQAIRGKVFYKVAARDAAGNTTLVSTIVQEMPRTTTKPGGKPGTTQATTANAKTTNVSIKVTQTVAPDGKVSGMSIESDDPQLTAIFKTFTPERLQQFADQNGSNFTGIYGVPLLLGQPRTTTTTLDAQSMFGSLFSAVAGPKGQEVFAKVQASPLSVNTTNTYMGLNAQGQHTFNTSSKFNDWRLTLNGKGNAPTISTQLLNAQSEGTSAYMPSGLPVAGNQKTSMNMKMTMQLDGLQVSMDMTIDQGYSLQPRP